MMRTQWGFANMYRRMSGGLCFKQSARQDIRNPLSEGRIGRLRALKQSNCERDLRQRDHLKVWAVIASRLQRYSECSHLFPSTKSQWNSLFGFWIIAEDKLCGKQTVMIHTSFVQQDNLHMKDTFCKSARTGSHHDVRPDLGDLEELSPYKTNITNIAPSSMRKGAGFLYGGSGQLIKWISLNLPWSRLRDFDMLLWWFI